MVLAGIAFLLVLLIPAHTDQGSAIANVHSLGAFRPTRAHLPEDAHKKGSDPIRWLEQNSNNKYAVSKGFHAPSLDGNRRPKAALISLVRNSELEGIMQSMRQLEFRWNRKYQVSGDIVTEENPNFLAVSVGLLQRRAVYRGIQSCDEETYICQVLL